MKFQSSPLAEHREVPLPDDGRFETLVAHFDDKAERVDSAGEGQNSCYVVCVNVGGRGAVTSGQVEEILALVRAQGDVVVGHEVVTIVDPDPRTLFRRGKGEAIAERAAALGANLLVVDAEVSPSQNRNLEDLTGLSITDREAIILNVFLKHARTRSSRIQIEISQLEYLRPRIRGLGLEMDQQAGGLTKARGPGETASELLARRLDGRLVDLKKTLAKLSGSSAERRRRRRACPHLVLVGYTNAGKTSLMNALTGAGLSARNMPFETLDTTSRALTRRGGDVLISDTVGFIRRLPERLLASFESTLSEIHDASLLVVVVDASDPERVLHIRTTDRLLEKLGAADVPRFYVLNKVDRLGVDENRASLAMLARGHPYAVLSTHDDEAVKALGEQLVRAARGDSSSARLFVPYDATELTTMIYATTHVLEARSNEDGMWFAIEGDASAIRAIKEHARREGQR